MHACRTQQREFRGIQARVTNTAPNKQPRAAGRQHSLSKSLVVGPAKARAGANRYRREVQDMTHQRIAINESEVRTLRHDHVLS